MAEISMETYLRSLKPTNRSYTIPDDKFTELLRRYTNMKKQIAECVEIKRQYDILVANKEYKDSQLWEIYKLQRELERVRQENAGLEKNTRDAISIADKAVIE